MRRDYGIFRTWLSFCVIILSFSSLWAALGIGLGSFMNFFFFSLLGRNGFYQGLLSLLTTVCSFIYLGIHRRSHLMVGQTIMGIWVVEMDIGP